MVEDEPPVVVGNVEPPKVEAGGAQPKTADPDDGTQAGDENVSTSSKSR